MSEDDLLRRVGETILAEYPYLGRVKPTSWGRGIFIEVKEEVDEAPVDKTVHMANLVSPLGCVSPLCARQPRAINLKRATWTNRAEAVTCRRCKSLLLDRDKPEAAE